MSDYDAIVVGAGGVGSAATYHLARRGADVLALERYDVPHAMGSSHGETRLFRLAYHEDARYVPLLRRARKLWRELETEVDERLLHDVGALTIGPPGSDVFESARSTCEAHGIDHEVLTGTEVNERYPAYELPAEYRAVHQPDSGFLAPERCVVAHAEAAQARGAVVRARERVTDWTDTGDGVTVTTDRGSYDADRLVVTAGAWAGRLLPELSDLFRVEREVAGWFQPSEPAAFAPEAMPAFTMASEVGSFYGTPRFGVPGFKLGGGVPEPPETTADGMDRQPSPADEAPLRGCLERYFPAADGPTMRLDACLLTQTPDEDFVVDTLPGRERVVVGAGFSGHGFKMASATGECLAELALDGATTLDIDHLRLDRFS